MTSSAGANPAEIAREAFKRLAIRRISPTPDAYRDIYNEIVGLPPTPVAAAAPVAEHDTGAEVVLNGFAVTLSADASRELAESMKDAKYPPKFFHCDLTDLDALAAAMAQVGTIDVLINNAANDDRHDVSQVTPAYWDERMNVNLRHLFFCAQAVAPGMKAAGGGVILNFGSISWHLAQARLPLYMTAKAAIEGMTRGLARDLGGDRIRVNCIVPGSVITPRQALCSGSASSAREPQF